MNNNGRMRMDLQFNKKMSKRGDRERGRLRLEGVKK